MNTWSRRHWLSAAVAAGFASRVSGAARTPLSPREFQARLRGPILSFPTVYRPDGALDLAGIQRMIDRAISAGVRVVTLTRGNNHYDWLTEQEIRQLTRSMVEFTAGRALTIAATGPWPTEQSVQYARFAAEVGADSVQVNPPAEGSDASQAEHFRAIARAAGRPIVIHSQPSMGLLRKLKEIENVVAIKEEFTTDYTVPIYAEFGDRYSIFAGGTKARLLAYRPYGMNAFYSAYSTFAPEIGMRFWNAVEKGDQKTAVEMVYRYDIPFFQRWSHPFWVATLECFGVATRHLRPPRESLTEEQMKEVVAFYRGLGLLDAQGGRA